MDAKGEGYSMQMISQGGSKLYDKPKEDWVGDFKLQRYVARAGEVCVPICELDGDCVNLRID